jgi:hypothetical protein
MICEMRGQTGFAFEKFRDFKKYWGNAGPDHVWHHIVEQNKEAQFGVEAIHNVYNVVSVPADINQKINSLYSSKRPYITLDANLTVRQWLGSKSYDEQREFGLWALQEATKGTLP